MPEVLKLQPLDQTRHLPYYSPKTNKKRPKARHKTRTQGEVTAPLQKFQLPHSKSLISCDGQSFRSGQGLASSCSSRLSEEKVPSRRGFPALPQSGGNTGDGYTSMYHPDPELRHWIVEFGGDEQAAFMARGLQKLQLAYETGKAEMYQSPQCNAATKC